MKIAVLLVACLLPVATQSMQAQTKIGAAPPVTYDNKYELYGGLNFMNFKAGENLPKRMNLGGAEISGTYWLTPRLGITAEYRGEAGTTQVFPIADVYGIHRPLVYMNMGLGGIQWRGPKNQHAAHARSPRLVVVHQQPPDRPTSPTTESLPKPPAQAATAGGSCSPAPTIALLPTLTALARSRMRQRSPGTGHHRPPAAP